MWLWVLGIVVLTGVVAVIAVGSGDSVGETYDDRPDTTVPVGRPLTADDLVAVRFNTAVRGYRMDEVDAFLARVRADLIARETAAHRPAAVEDEPALQAVEQPEPVQQLHHVEQRDQPGRDRSERSEHEPTVDGVDDADPVYSDRDLDDDPGRTGSTAAP